MAGDGADVGRAQAACAWLSYHSAPMRLIVGRRLTEVDIG
jgi:hypothetical protein